MHHQGFGEAPQDLGFVRASGHRSRIVFCLAEWPRTTGQVGLSCGLSLPHASRAVKELLDRGLVACLTPEIRGRGRQYALTDLGKAVADRLTLEDRRAVTVPMVRASQPRGWYLAMAQRFGPNAAVAVMQAVGLSLTIDGRGPRWVPVRQLLL